MNRVKAKLKTLSLSPQSCVVERRGYELIRTKPLIWDTNSGCHLPFNYFKYEIINSDIFSDEYTILNA